MLVGGARHAAGTAFYQPTVLGDMPADMRSSCEEIFGPVLPLAPKTVALMTSNHLSAEVAYPSSMRSLLSVIAPTPEMGQGFGLGFAVRTDVGQNPSPGSVGDFYWAGASGTYFWVDPQEQLVVVALTAQPKVDVKIRYRQLARQLVYQALETSLSHDAAVWSSSSARPQKVLPATQVRGELPSLVP